MATARPARLAVTFVVVVAVVLGAFFGVRALWRIAERHFTSAGCTIGAYELDTAQASVASTMVGAATAFRPKLPDRAAMLALAAALQESKLTNLAPNAGDRDSVGVLQQRPSQGWGGGDPARLNDVTEATREFLAALVKVKDWQSLPAADAIQKVQISADGSAYAKHEAEAQVLADALLGRQPAGISCRFDKPTVVATPAKVITQLKQQLAIRRATAAGATIRVPGAGWQAACWFVANADRLGVDSVSYAGKRWSRADGWRPATAPASAVVATMAQL